MRAHIRSENILPLEICNYPESTTCSTRCIAWVIPRTLDPGESLGCRTPTCSITLHITIGRGRVLQTLGCKLKSTSRVTSRVAQNLWKKKPEDGRIWRISPTDLSVRFFLSKKRVGRLLGYCFP